MTPKNIEPARSYEAGDTMTPKSLEPVREYIASQVIGQKNLVDGMLICLLSDGHLLVEGMPGLAKTTAVMALSDAIEGDFHRIQFTPDLLPADLIRGSKLLARIYLGANVRRVVVAEKRADFLLKREFFLAECHMHSVWPH